MSDPLGVVAPESSSSVLLDTVRANLISNGWKNPRGWDRSEGKTKWQKDDVTGESFHTFAQHRETEFKIGGDEFGGVWVEGSLPRLVYGSNDHVLKPEHLSTAFDALNSLLQTTHENIKIINFSRLDIAGQFPILPSDAYWAHVNDKHPRIRSVAQTWFGSGLAWQGKGLYGRIYDKELERKRGPGTYTRMEWQLRAHVLKKEFTGDPRQRVVLEDITAAKIYQVYRDLTLGFAPAPIKRVRSIYELINLGEECGWKDAAGRSVLQICQSGKSARTASRYRKFAASNRPETWKIDWHKMLPEDAQGAAIVWEPTHAAA